MSNVLWCYHWSLQWRHNGRDSVSNHQPHYCLLNRFIQTQIKENIKAPRHWPLCEEFTGDRWIPRTNCQLRGKWFHLMTSWRKMNMMYYIHAQQHATLYQRIDWYILCWWHHWSIMTFMWVVLRYPKGINETNDAIKHDLWQRSGFLCFYTNVWLETRGGWKLLHCVLVTK